MLTSAPAHMTMAPFRDKLAAIAGAAIFFDMADLCALTQHAPIAPHNSSAYDSGNQLKNSSAANRHHTSSLLCSP
jgi:hypothetical protein